MFNHNLWSIPSNSRIPNILLACFIFGLLVFQIMDYVYFHHHLQHLFALKNTTLTRMVEHPYFWLLTIIELIPLLITFINRKVTHKIFSPLLIFYVAYALFFVWNIGISPSLFMILLIKRDLKEISENTT